MRGRTSIGKVFLWTAAALFAAMMPIEPRLQAASHRTTMAWLLSPAQGAAAGARAARQLRKVNPAARKAQGRRPGFGPRFIERLMRMPAGQRRRFLQRNKQFQRLRPQQRQRLQQRLERLSRMPPRQRQQVLERYRLFDRLPPQKQSQARDVYRRWRQIPQERRRELLKEFEGLREASPDARRKRLASEELGRSYSDEEIQVLEELTGLLPSRTPEGRSRPPSKPGAQAR